MIDITLAKKKDYASLPMIEADAAQVFSAYGLESIAQMSPKPESYYDNLPNNTAIFLAKTQHLEPIGFVIIQEVDTQAYIQEISVCYAQSGQGIGRALLDKAITYAHNQAYTWIALTTFAHLPFNAPFYKKAGFEPFTPDESWSDLRNIQENERKTGLDKMPRIAMRRKL